MAQLAFLPGAGGSASFWKPVAARLADLGPVQLFGWPGFGDFPADPNIRSLEDLFHWFLQRLSKGANHVIAQSMPGVPNWFLEDRTDFTDRLAEIRAPTLLVWSDADPISPLAISRFLAERMPRARGVTVRGGTHAFANERPDEVAALIRSHLSQGYVR
jgi:pimeloyl-ACP methyl ester carboxylesterase